MLARVFISVSMLISAINALTITPALAVLFFSGRKPGKHGGGKEALPWWSFGLFGGLASVWLLTPILGPALGLTTGEGHGEAAPGGLSANLAALGATLALALPGVLAGGVLGRFIVRPVNWLPGFFFRSFNWATRVYGRVVGWCLRFSAVVLVVYVGLIGLTGWGFSRIPTGFIPMQDKGYLATNIQLPDSASLEPTLEVTDAVEKIALQTPGVSHTLCLPGMSYLLNANSSSYSNVFIIFQPLHDRRDPALGGHAIASKIRERLAREIPEARILVFGARPISGLGTSAGFKLMVEGIGDVDYDALQARADDLAAKGNQQPGLAGLFNGFRARTPQLYLDIDRAKAKSMGVALTDVFDTLQACVGSSYVNDFNRFGRTWQVNVQTDVPFRTDHKNLHVRGYKEEGTTTTPFDMVVLNELDRSPQDGAARADRFVARVLGRTGDILTFSIRGPGRPLEEGCRLESGR